VEQALSSGGLRRTLRFTGELPGHVREDLERSIGLERRKALEKAKERDG
jgi:hypothetical protein